MDKIGFKTAVQFTGDQKSRHQSLMEKVDNYFYFGGRKVVVEQKADGHEVAVGFVEQPVSTGHKVLKALSYVIFPIPLAMLGMKLVLRKIYEIDAEKMDPTIHFQEDNQGTVTKVRTVKDELLETGKDEGVEYERLKKRVLNKEQANSVVPPLTLSEEDRKLLLLANEDFYTEHPGLRLARTGEHSVFFLDSQPNFVFKRKLNMDLAEKDMSVTETAHRVVEEEQLDLIFIPQDQIIDVEGALYIVQEKAQLVSGNYEYQKGLYYKLWADPDMKEYMQKLFKQLVTFIVKTEYNDVKYDNIPLTINGQVALIDLDQNSAIGGLTRGGASRAQGGILNYASLDDFDDFCEQARLLLGDKASILEESLSKIRERLETRAAKDEQYEKFCDEHAIHSARQPLNDLLPKLFEDEKKQKFAVDFVKSINEELLKTQNVFLRRGRKVYLGTNVGQVVFQIAEKYDRNGYRFVSQNLEEICQKLQEAGYIFKFKFNKTYNFITITC